MPVCGGGHCHLIYYDGVTNLGIYESRRPGRPRGHGFQLMVLSNGQSVRIQMNCSLSSISNPPHTSNVVRKELRFST